MRDIIALACTECKRRNYSTTKNKKKTTERLEFSKYCRFCRKHTAHKESEVIGELVSWRLVNASHSPSRAISQRRQCEYLRV